MERRGKPRGKLNIMCALLAYADSTDSSAANMMIVLGGAFVVALAAGLAFVLILISRVRAHRQEGAIAVAAIFWALIAAGSLIYAGESQMNWSKEYQMRLESGYLDPAEMNDAPHLPWGIWTGLGVAYGAMLAWTLSQKRARPPAG
jgi:hypothetical protein